MLQFTNKKKKIFLFWKIETVTENTKQSLVLDIDLNGTVWIKNKITLKFKLI